MRKVLEDKERLQWFAAKLAAQKDIFFIGRGIDYAITLEGSLKMKEISYIRFSIDGVEYEEYSSIASTSNLPGSDFSDYGDIPTTDGAINESDIFITP